MGNPKGKAVDHFTNIIAEMRSYGQGVIVAEQIPSKLAPDVIKNTSNKIVHRIVSVDDQQIIANTIGVSAEDAIQIGTMKTGYALCHKEGMTLPVSVCIDKVADVTASDDTMYVGKIKERMPKIYLSRVDEVLANSSEAKEIAYRLLNTVLVENADILTSSVTNARKMLRNILRQSNSGISFEGDLPSAIPEFLARSIIKFLVCGIYATDTLPDDGFYELLVKFIDTKDKEFGVKIKDQLKALYGNKDTGKFARQIVAGNILLRSSGKFDIEGSIKAYFIDISAQNYQDIFNQIQRGR